MGGAGLNQISLARAQAQVRLVYIIEDYSEKKQIKWRHRKIESAPTVAETTPIVQVLLSSTQKWKQQ